MAQKLIPPLLLLLGAACAGTRTGLFNKDVLPGVRAAFAEGRYEDVAAAVPESSIADIPNRRRPEAYHLLGLSYERMHQPAKALQIYQLAASLYPEDLKLLTDLGNLLNQVGLPERARAHYERVLKRHPNNAGAHLGLAEIFHKIGFVKDSISHYEKTLALWRDNPHVWHGYSQALSAASRFEEALEAAERAHALTADASTWTAMARAKRSLGKTEEAYADLQQAASLVPKRQDLGLERGLWLLEDGRLADAAAAAEAVLAITPGEPLARWLRASVLLREGRRENARSDLEVSASAARTHPFIAKTAGVMLEQLGEKP